MTIPIRQTALLFVDLQRRFLIPGLPRWSPTRPPSISTLPISKRWPERRPRSRPDE
jgi:nicotinamidase-related amidase